MNRVLVIIALVAIWYFTLFRLTLGWFGLNWLLLIPTNLIGFFLVWVFLKQHLEMV